MSRISKEMESSVRIGKWIVISTGLACCLISASVTSLYLAEKGLTVQTFLPRAIRFLITVIIFVLIYRGSGWARWVAIILFGSTAIYSFALDDEMIRILGKIYLAVAVVLLFPNVKEYQMHKRQYNKAMQTD